VARNPQPRAISDSGQIAPDVAADDASSGHGNGRLNKLPVADLRVGCPRPGRLMGIGDST
jgi:hypothetical protein